MRYRNLILIGSSHVAKASIEEVRKTIEKENPDIVAIELDRDRLHALLSPEKKGGFAKGVGFKGMLFAAIGAWAEKSIGKIVHVEPGSEMKMAVQMAKEHNAKLALIDQNISVTLRHFSEQITWREKWRFIVDIVLGTIMPQRHLKTYNLTKEDLSKVPDRKTIKKLLNFVKKRYPNFYNVLVHERNIVMANNLAALMKHYPKEKIVAVVGAGHEDELVKLIREKLYKRSSA